MDTLEAMEALLRMSPAAQLLFEGETLTAMSPAAQQLFPRVRTGDALETLLGQDAAPMRDFDRRGSLRLSHEGLEITAAGWAGRLLLTVAQPETEADRSAMQTVADRLAVSLSSMLAVTPQLLPQLEDPERPENMRLAAELNREIYGLLRLSRNLQLGGAPMEQLTLQTVGVELDRWLRALVERLEPLCRAADRPLSLQCEGDRFSCQIDTALMERAVLHLVSNAMKFSKPGGEIRLILQRSGRRLVLRLQDQGCGIPADQMPNIFRRTVERGMIPDPRWGVGVGLPLTKRIVEAHGGTLMLESVEGEGTTVFLSLPAGRTGTAPLRTQVLRPEVSGGIDSALVELADVLPAWLFDTRGLDL